MADRPETEALPWLPDRGSKTWADYVCPACGGMERVSSLVDRPLMHRHPYGGSGLQTGVVMLQKVEG